MKKTRLENWSVQGSSYDAPEIGRHYLVGEVYNHPKGDRHSDGKRVATSRIVKVDGKIITTRSGTVYHLGEVDSDYETFLRDKGYDFDPDNPIKIVQEVTIWN